MAFETHFEETKGKGPWERGGKGKDRVEFTSRAIFALLHHSLALLGPMQMQMGSHQELGHVLKCLCPPLPSWAYMKPIL